MNSKDKKVLTLGIFAHANAGKTTITEHLLYHTGVIKTIGRVDNGNTITDNLKVEQQRGITVRASLVSFDINEKNVQLIDTPGHVDFSAEVERAINVLDGAVLVISGVEGLESQTFTIWKALQKKKVPVIIFINKMDRKGADYDKVLGELKKYFDIHTLTITHVYQKHDGDLEITPSSYNEIIEELSLVDDEILKQYVDNVQITNSLMADKIIELTKTCKLFPIIGGSALNDAGMTDLVECIGKYIPVAPKSLNCPLSAYVYTIRIDETGKNAYVKVLDGSMGLKDNLQLGENKTTKINRLYLVEGAKLVSVDAVYSGDITVINGIDVKCGQFIGAKKDLDQYANFVNPLLTMEVKPINTSESIELMEALKILNEEDPYLNVRYNERKKSIYCSLMGEVQAQIIKTYLEERFNIRVNIENPVIIHREVPTVSARAKATYTTVSGAGIEITPLERGSGFRYVSKISTDFLHTKYQRQIEKLIKHYSKQGLHGWELTDIEVALVDGQFDSMGSDPMHFNIIAPLALYRCLKQARMRLLEPILNFTTSVPASSVSAIMKLLSSKNAFYKLVKNIGETVTIEGEVSSANMMNFPVELSMITSGRGIYSSYISKYELSHNQDIENDYIGADPRNETTFVINDMKASLEPLDKTLMKKKKESRSKFARQQREKEFGKKK
jgi:ribosomal protection tetracycline resistance protein